VSGVKPGADAILRAWRAADAAGTQAEARNAWPRIARRIGRPGSTALAFLACAVAGTALLWAAADFPRKGLPDSRRRGLMGLTRDPTMKSIQAAPASKFLSATLAATAMLAPDAMAQNAAKQWRVEDGGNGHWYAARRWDFPKTWPEARDAAIARGGYLACVTSAAESQWLGANMTLEQPGCGLGRMGWHLGGYQDRSAPDYSEPAGGWRWVSGEPWAFTAWLTEANYPGLQGGDRPNNFGDDEQYLKMSELPYAPWWDDVGTTSDQNDLCGAIIEWSADCDNDGQVDIGQILRGEALDANANGVPDHCEITCADADLYANGEINGADLGILLSEWGVAVPGSRSDIDGDGLVDGVDLAYVLAFWGPCGG